MSKEVPVKDESFHLNLILKKNQNANNIVIRIKFIF